MNAGPVIETSAGKVRGTISRNIEGKEFFSFRGVPYAKPPVGSLRFQDPQPVMPWQGIRNADTFGSSCPHMEQLFCLIVGNEDCLYLNVYSNNLDIDARQPVLFSVHGGAFTYGNGGDSLYGPDYLMRKNVVLVTINYRLGIFGFLNLGDEIAPGNQGLKDALMALQWVHDNIVNFGGDPNNVTLFGESAGAMMAHFLIISPLSKGLYHKAILQSGTIYNPWSFLKKNVKQSAYRMCEALGKKTTDSKEIFEFLQTIDFKKLVSIQEELYDEKYRLLMPFGPGVDDNSKNPFMPADIMEAVDKGVQVPLLIGNTSREGLIFCLYLQDAYRKFNENFAEALHPRTKDTLNRYNLTLDKLKRMYFGSKKITLDNLGLVVDLLSDVYFVEGVHRLLNTQLEKSSSPTYYFQYAYARSSIMKTALKSLNLVGHDFSGASHVDDLTSLFRSNMFDKMLSKTIAKGSQEYQLMEQMTDMWANFATCGNPTPSMTNVVPLHWEPVSSKGAYECLQISEILRMTVVEGLEQKYLDISQQ